MLAFKSSYIVGLISGMNEKLLQPFDKGACTGITCRLLSCAPLMVKPQGMPCVTWNYSAAVRASCSGEKGQRGTFPLPLPRSGSSFIEAPITGDKSHCLCNPGCLGARGGWPWHAPMVLWESPGQEETLMGASTLAGLAEVHVIYVGLKCTGFIQESRQSPCPGELASEA